MKKIETVNEHCKHKDCVYRGHLGQSGNIIETCDYIIFERKRRGCKISECDKYRRGSRTVIIDERGFYTVLGDENEIADI